MSSKKETQQLKQLETFTQFIKRNVWMKELAEDGLQNSVVKISSSASSFIHTFLSIN